MPKLFITLAVSFTCIFGALGLVAPVLGTGQPLNPALTPFVEGCQDKPQPCWFGVVPGVTTESEVYDLLTFRNGPRLQNRQPDSYSSIFTLPETSPYCDAIVQFRNKIVFQMELSLCRQPAIRVGDMAVLVANEPQVISLPPEELLYGNVSMHVDGWPTLYSRVAYIMLFSNNDYLQRYPWHGYTSQEHYCQLVPNYPPCR